MKNAKSSTAVLGLLAAGLVLRLGYAYRVYRAVMPNPSSQVASALDPDSYDLLAQNLVRNGRYEIGGAANTDREPFYPLALALIHAIFGPSLIPALALNALIGIVCCVLVFAISLRLFADERAALLSLIAAVFYPEWIYYGAYFYRETLMTFLIGLWIWLWLSRRERLDVLNHALMGLCLGALGLTRAAMLPLGAAFIPLAALRIEPRRWIKTLGLFILCAGALQAPWAWRNETVTGRWVAGSTMGGGMMYLSLLKNYALPDEPLEAPLNSAQDPLIARIKAEKIPPAQAQGLYYRASWDILIHKPAVFWLAFLHKALKMWRLYPTPGWRYGQSQALLAGAGLISNGLLLVFGLWGAILAFKRGYEIGFLLCVPLVATVVCALYWSVMRFHSPLMLVFMPLAGYSASGLLPRTPAEP